MRNKYIKPPRWAAWILARLIDHRDRASLIDDLENEYKELLVERSLSYATIWYLFQILRALPELLISNLIWSTNMFKNYLTVALRVIQRNKVFSLINILGLSIGFTFSIMIFSYVHEELSYDSFHINNDDIYRVVMKQIGNEWMGTDMWNVTPGPVKQAFFDNFSEIESIARLRSFNGLLKSNDNTFEESGFFIADPEFLEIFNFPLIRGDLKTVLLEPYSVVITEEILKKYFGDDDPIGRIIQRNGGQNFIVTGVLRDIPDNTHFEINFLGSYASLESIYKGNPDRISRWGNNHYKTYLKINGNSDNKQFENKFPVQKSDLHKENDNHGMSSEFHLQPITDIHLSGFINATITTNNTVNFLYMFSAIAILILVIASLNYINLSTAASINRFKEVGIRKVVGAYKKNLVKQFMTESIILTIFAIILSFFFIKLFLPEFNLLVDRNLTISFFNSFSESFTIIVFALTLGVFAGIYPSLFMSSFQPITMLKNKNAVSSSKRFSLRNVLVIVQFALSIIMIVSTLVIYNQMNFINNKDMGYQKEQVLTIQIKDGNLKKNYQNFQSELLAHKNIKDIAISDYLPSYIINGGGADWEGKEAEENISFYRINISHNFLDFYGINLLGGRNFSEDFTTDVRKAFIVNSSTVEHIGWDDPIGKRFNMWLDDDAKVIGVVDDFHFHDLGSKIKPLVIGLVNPVRLWEIQYFSVKVDVEDLNNTILDIEKSYKKFAVDYPFEYEFLDENINAMYKSEQKLAKSFIYFSSFAIFVSCLGLFGLALFTAKVKTKEIGIRKTLGATAQDITLLLGSEYLKWILISSIIACPISYFVMSEWLKNNFAYRTDIGLSVFASSIFLAVIIAIFSILFQTLKAALSNPVDSLRDE